MVQPISETEFGGADLHVLDLAQKQNEIGIFEPIILLSKNKKLQQRFTELGIKCLCGYEAKNILAFIRWANRKLKTNTIDLIHSHGYDSNYQMVLLKKMFPKKWKKIPTVITSHGWIETNFFLKFKTRLDFYCHSFADALIVCAKKNLKRLKKVDGQTHDFVPNGISFDPFNKQSIEQLPYKQLYDRQLKKVAYVGRLSAEKRVDLFLKSAFEVLKKRNDVVYFVVGDGLENSSLKKMVEDSGHSANICFTGLLENVSEIYKNIDLLILSSDTESTPRVVIEALYNQVPVVATEVGDVPLLVVSNKNGFVVPKGDWKKISEHTQNILEDDEVKTQLGKNGKAHIEKHFTISIMENEISNIYKKII